MIKKLYIIILVICFTIINSCKTNADDNNQKWIGKYFVESYNKDNLKTSFDITIFNLDSINLLYISDDNPPEKYYNLKAIPKSSNKIKIIFNLNYKEMGIIYLEKSNDKYFISGDPIYFINPGNGIFQISKSQIIK
ncbi:hypothetical protein O2K51_04050 [Apibacter raozihei]|uniref:hypothetical protein n=1 Tax=Apibacter raozihei TaxID=2500547 RepID=UPI000FE42943|nr:hypothetical protein [Apibacter raozihei]